MVVASFLLVLAGAATLLVGGVLRPSEIGWIFASIGCSLLAALFLVIGVVRSPARQRGSQPLLEREPLGERDTPATGDAGEPTRFERGLSTIPGVGPDRRAELAAHFGSYQALEEASVEELSAVPGISPALARRIHEQLPRA